MSSPLIDIKNLSFSYSSKDVVLKSINLELHSGEILGVIGPNGGGKSTLLNILAGIIPFKKGTFLIDGKNVKKSKFPYNLFSYIPQVEALNPHLPMKVSELLDLEFINSNSSYADPDELLRKLKATHLKNKLISQLSGGERQRVLLVRALIKKPKILVLDEPTTALDANGVDQLITLIQELSKEDMGIIIVDHNINQVLKHANKILCLNKTHHWHDFKENLTRNVLESIYHCEYEHLLIHENVHSDVQGHHHCCDHKPGSNMDEIKKIKKSEED